MKTVNYLILSLTSRCNLKCRYCYQRSDSKGLDMSDEVIAQAMRLADTGTPLLIQLTGGEPTLVPDRIQLVATLARRMKSRAQLAIQTNGTLLTPELVALFTEYKMQVGVSLDGPPETQECLRGKADDTLRGLKLLEEGQVDFRITTVVSSENVFVLDRLALLLSGFGYCRGIGLDLLVAKGRGGKGPVFPATEKQLKKGATTLVRTLNGLNRRRHRPILLRELELVKKSRNEPNPHFCHAAAGKSLAVFPDGSMFPCGQTMCDQEFSFGTVFSPRLQQKTALVALRLVGSDCLGCSLSGRCPGECPSRIHYNNRENAENICHLYRQLDALNHGYIKECE